MKESSPSTSTSKSEISHPHADRNPDDFTRTLKTLNDQQVTCIFSSEHKNVTAYTFDSNGNRIEITSQNMSLELQACKDAQSFDKLLKDAYAGI